MAFRWPKEGVSVVLLPSGELGQQVLSLAKEWTAHRLLAPSLFVVVEEQDPRALEPFTSSGPVRMAAHVIGRDGTVVDSLIDQLGRDDLDLKKTDKIASYIDDICLLYTSPSPRDRQKSRMPSSA